MEHIGQPRMAIDLIKEIATEERCQETARHSGEHFLSGRYVHLDLWLTRAIHDHGISSSCASI